VPDPSLLARRAPEGSARRDRRLFLSSMTDFIPRISTPRSDERANSLSYALSASVLVATLWLLCRPFRGIRHDAILYFGQTFNHIWPGRLSADWFFLGASQDKYTVYSPLMAHAIQLVGLQPAHMGLLLAFNAFFLWASWLLVAQFPSRMLRWSALVSLGAFSHVYGGMGAFGFAEPFLTARSLAEPFAVLGLALLLRGRIGLGLLAALFCAACHPLPALCMLVIGWVYLGLGDRRWWWLALLLPVAPLLGWFNVGPFGGLLHSFDPKWFHAVTEANADCFLLKWGKLDWTAVAMDVIVVLLGRRLFPGTGFARLCLATLVAAAGLTVAWGLGADLAHNVLLTQLQFWRVFWIAHLLALLMLPALFLHYWRGDTRDRWVLSALVLAVVAAQANWDTGWLACLWLVGVLAVTARVRELSPFVLRAGIAVSILCTVIVSFILFVKTYQAVFETHNFGAVSSLSILFSLMLIAAPAGFVALWLLQSPRPATRAVTALGVLALLFFSVKAWDQRSAWQVYMEDGFDRQAQPFDGQLPPNASVYWDNQPLPVWMMLKRPSYFSANQASGLVFSRDAAMEFARRKKPFVGLLIQADFCLTIAAVQTPGYVGDCRPSVELMKDICNVPGGGPDYMIFNWRRPEGLVGSWNFDAAPPPERMTWYLYDCSKLR
jgi:hypothetical protein